MTMPMPASQYQVGDQRKMHGPLGRHLGGRPALQDRRAGVAGGGEQREKNTEERVHGYRMQVHVNPGLV